MAKHKTRVGLHARNDVHFPEPDYALVRLARIETIKMMSFTDVSVYQRLRRENRDIEFVVRLYDDRFSHQSRPSPAAFVAKMVPVINRLKPYATKFEIHNEPNHVDGIEGWGASDAEARSFRDWYMQVLPALKSACPWADFGFPGLALNYPHRDLEWLEICRAAIRASDWLGCHCYWQYNNMLKDEWGLRFKLYHQRFPSKRIEITEFGNSTPNLPREKIAKEYTQYYPELNKYPYVGSASAFIASSPDPTWALFVWMKEGGEMLPVARAVRDIPRKPTEVPAPPRPKPPVIPDPGPKRTFPQTGKTVRGSFLTFFGQYSLDICGYPITEQIEEAGIPTQYFQRIGLEEVQPGKIRLKLIGAEAWTSRAKIAQLEARIKELRARPPSGAGPAKPAVEDVVDKLPRHASKQYPRRSLTDIDQIVIHHTGTSPTITPKRMAQYQVERQDKPGITHHFFIAADGTIYETNELETLADHAFERSRESVGVCFAGNFTSSLPTPSQIEAGGQLCAWLLGELRLPADKIVGLSEFVKTQSPGTHWLSGQRWKDKLLAEVGAALETGAEDQSELVASLRDQIQALQDEIERLRQRSPAERSTSPAQGIVDKLSDLVVSLQAQIKILQGELARMEAFVKAQGEDQSALIASLRAQIAALQNEKKKALADMAAALDAKADEQAALIASLQAKITALQREIEKLRQQPPSPQPAPPPTPDPAEISAPPIQDMVDKLRKHETKQYGTRPRSAIETLVIHHSAVPPSVGPQKIANYHVSRLDWPGAGYHFMVAADGIVYQANTVETVSHHAAKVNPRGVGICFLGNFDAEVPPPAQLQAGAHLVAWLMQELDVALDDVKGHQEFMGTACPGNQWRQGKNWKQMLRQQIAGWNHKDHD
jgi:N-acetyl-anhydromuramyl-L-alanine amidase AmpD